MPGWPRRRPVGRPTPAEPAGSNGGPPPGGSKPMPAGRERRAVKPLLSVDEAAILLGASRSSVYRSIERGDLPVPVFKINGRLRIARASVERLLVGDLPVPSGEGAVKAGGAAEWHEGSLDGTGVEGPASHDGRGRSSCGRPGRICRPQPRSVPTCSAARRSSSATPSV
ncbi:MAG: helix-turn-helix domain-containing protein [Acidimicrobiales bacterium]